MAAEKVLDSTQGNIGVRRQESCLGRRGASPGVGAGPGDGSGLWEERTQLTRSPGKEATGP